MSKSILSNKPKERFVIVTCILRHIEVQEQQDKLNEYAVEGWKLVSVSDGIAYFIRQYPI